MRPDPRSTPDIVDDLEDEQHDLQQLLASLTPDQWLLPTPAAGWDVRDQVSHLADTEEWAVDTATGGPKQINVLVEQYPSGDALTLAGCLRGREMTPAQVLAWWVGAAERNRATLRSLDPSTRIPWGLGMGWRAFVTARLMEHWAHGLDIRAAVGRPGVDTARLRHIAWIGLRAVPYALGVAGVEAPAGRTLRLELVGPAGDTWRIGPDDATDVVRGPAGEFCRLAVQRIGRADAAALGAEGPLAELALAHARAFL